MSKVDTTITEQSLLLSQQRLQHEIKLLEPKLNAFLDDGDEISANAMVSKIAKLRRELKEVQQLYQQVKEASRTQEQQQTKAKQEVTAQIKNVQSQVNTHSSEIQFIFKELNTSLSVSLPSPSNLFASSDDNTFSFSSIFDAFKDKSSSRHSTSNSSSIPDLIKFVKLKIHYMNQLLHQLDTLNLDELSVDDKTQSRTLRKQTINNIESKCQLLDTCLVHLQNLSNFQQFLTNGINSISS